MSRINPVPDYADSWNTFIRTLKTWIDKVDLLCESLKVDHKNHALGITSRSRQKAADHAFKLMRSAWRDLDESMK